MDHDKKLGAEGKLDELGGKIKQGWGDLTDDPQMQGEGMLDEAKGNVKQGVGEVMDRVGDAAHDARNKGEELLGRAADRADRAEDDLDRRT